MLLSDTSADVTLCGDVKLAPKALVHQGGETQNSGECRDQLPLICIWTQGVLLLFIFFLINAFIKNYVAFTRHNDSFFKEVKPKAHSREILVYL